MHSLTLAISFFRGFCKRTIRGILSTTFLVHLHFNLLRSLLAWFRISLYVKIDKGIQKMFLDIILKYVERIVKGSQNLESTRAVNLVTT